MENEFVTYEQALALKELGFNESCFGWFTNSHLRIGGVIEDKHVQGIDEMLSPLKQQTFKWLREKYELDAFVFNSGGNNYSFHITYNYLLISDNYFLNTTYEKAENSCIDKLIEIAKQKEI